MTDGEIDWSPIDRALMAAATPLRRADRTEEVQAVGLFCREGLISLAQAVFNSSRHTTGDGVQPSATDSKRMLDAFFSYELSGGANEETRRHARASVSLADALVHRRTATYRDAALCLEATQSTANLASIVTGRSETDRVLPADVEPFRVPRLGDPVLQSIVDHYRQQGLDTVLPRLEERDVRLASGHRIAYYPGTRREVWVGYHGGRYEHILMIRPGGA